MSLTIDQILQFLRSVHPYDALPADVQSAIVGQIDVRDLEPGTSVYEFGSSIPGLFIIYDGAIEVRDEQGAVLSYLGSRNSFGERGLLKNGLAVTTATADTAATLLVVPSRLFKDLIRDHQPFARFFDRSRKPQARERDLATTQVSTFMAGKPITCAADDTVQLAATRMRENHVSSLCVVNSDDALIGIVTIRDLSGKILAEGRPIETPVEAVMTADPVTLAPSSIGADVLHLMMERQHRPCTDCRRWETGRDRNADGPDAVPSRQFGRTGQRNHQCGHGRRNFKRHGPDSEPAWFSWSAAAIGMKW
jgi:CBS domain-containing protein